jgi:hypothetical protein
MSPLKLDLKGLNDLFDRTQAAKDRKDVFEIIGIVMRDFDIKTEYGVGPIKYDVLNKINETLDMKTPEQLAKTLSEIGAVFKKREQT